MYIGDMVSQQQVEHVLSPNAEDDLRSLLGTDGFASFMRRTLLRKRMPPPGSRSPHESRVRAAIYFASLDDLVPDTQFLLACGPLGDLARAKRALPGTLAWLDGRDI